MEEPQDGKRKRKMEFILENLMKGARLGRLLCSNPSSTHLLETPSCLIHTRGGATPNLTRDLEEQLLDQLQPNGVTGSGCGFMLTMPTLYMTYGF